jgi:Na+-transporting NADH:ubiquinone oxidoreductase subunit NqrC
MTLARAATVNSRNVQARASLRLVPASASSSARTGTKLVGILTIGALVIALLNLFLHILTSTAVYELAGIQQDKRELATTSQILAEEVDSLSSQQNLSNSAQSLGMIANANPVFLSIENQKVYGKPKAALNTDGRIARNLIPNSVLTQTSGNLKSSVASVGTTVTADVANPKVDAIQVISNGGAIPASPTH